MRRPVLRVDEDDCPVVRPRQQPPAIERHGPIWSGRHAEPAQYVTDRRGAWIELDDLARLDGEQPLLLRAGGDRRAQQDTRTDQERDVAGCV
jgi:hypothetical protein